MLDDPHYNIGNLVQLVRGGAVHTVVWRGQQKLLNQNGFVVRQWVYRLDNGFWDCYYEEELHTAWRWLD